MDVELLNQAFHNFTAASKSLETYYESLQEKVRYLTEELDHKNQQLKEALSEAEENKDYLNAILYNLEEAIIVLNPDGRVVMMNRSAEKIFQVAPEDTIGNFFADMDFTISEDGADALLHVRNRKYAVILSHSAVVDSKGSLRGDVILVKDITRLKELEVRHERNQRLIAMGEMAAKLVHEIRNPLCSVELFASLLAGELEDPRHKELARGISTGVSNLNSILTNMLFFAKPRKSNFRQVRVGRVIEEIILMFMPMLESRRIVLQKTLCDCEIRGDEELLKQVFMNIVMNAFQAVPDGGKIEVTVQKIGEFSVVAVTDNGDGIEPENMEKIFDPFFSTKDSGTGLGLAIASMILQGHSGYIKVHSKKNEGSTFNVYLPEGQE